MSNANKSGAEHVTVFAAKRNVGKSQTVAELLRILQEKKRSEPQSTEHGPPTIIYDDCVNDLSLFSMPVETKQVFLYGRHNFLGNGTEIGPCNKCGNASLPRLVLCALCLAQEEK